MTQEELDKVLELHKKWMNWNLDNEAYRVEARSIKEENIMLFDFNKATLLT